MWTNEKIPTPSWTPTHRPPGYRPGTTLGGLAWRGQLRWEFYQYYYQLYQLDDGMPLRGTRCLSWSPNAYVPEQNKHFIVIIFVTSYVYTVKPPISGPPIFGHIPQPDDYNLNSFYKKIDIL